MKTGTRFLTLAGLLLTGGFLFTVRSQAQPPFDHDPMSITITGGDMPYTASYKRTQKIALRDYQDLPPNSTRTENTITIQIKVGKREDVDPSKKVVHLFFNQAFSRETGFKRTLWYDTSGAQNDYTITDVNGNEPQYGKIVGGVATFKVLFHLKAIEDASGDSNNDGYEKIHIVATILAGANHTPTKHYIFQTITVWDKDK